MDGKTIQKVQKNYIYFTDGSVYFYDSVIEEWNTENEIDAETIIMDQEIDEEELNKEIERCFPDQISTIGRDRIGCSDRERTIHTHLFGHQNHCIFCW